MNRKTITALCLLPVGAFIWIAATQVQPGSQIKDYPNTGNPADTATYPLQDVTTKNITHAQLRFRMTNGLATTGYVNSVSTVVSNGLVTYVLVTSNTLSGQAGFARLEVQTNGVRLGLITNINWTYGMTGSVSSTTATLGVDDAIANAALSNSLFTLINTVSNFIATSTVQVATNDTMMVLQATPNSGSQWYVGANQTPATNGARGGFEFHSTLRALRMGDASGVQWNDTNTGRGSVNFGSNNIAGGRFTTIAGGRNNITHTNVENAFIGGGLNHQISTNSTNVVICGGENNFIALACENSFIGGGVSQTIRRAAPWSTIGGGASHICTDPYNTIGGGINNFISDESSGNDINSRAATISGGEESIARGLRSTIGGGYKHNLLSDCDYSVISGGSSNGMGISGGIGNGTQFSVISGGSQNGIGSVATFSVISGGAGNSIGANASNSVISGGRFNTIGLNNKFSSILGGERNTISANYAVAIGTSNTVSVDRGVAIGTGVNVTSGGTVVIGNASQFFTSVTVSGAGTGSTNYTLQAINQKMNLGSSNVNIVAVMQTTAGQSQRWRVAITNDSPDTWGFSASSVTNRWFWQSYMYGTNAPAVLTNNTRLVIDGESEGTNTWAEFKYYTPAK